MGTLVHSLEQTRKMLDNHAARVRREEREKIASALEAQADTLELLNAASADAAARVLRAIAKQTRAALAADAPAPNPLATPRAGELPDGTLLVTPEERARMYEAAANDLATQFKADEERIERDRQARAARGSTADDSIAEDASLPPMREHDDAASGLALVQGRRLGMPPSL